jgi:adenylate kinase
MNIIMYGASGSGKGTHAKFLSRDFGFVHISTGDILRQNIANRTELGKIAEQYINDGKWVPDDLMNELVADRLKQDDCKKGFILDGYPRTFNQAEFLSKIVKIDRVVLINLDLEIIKARLMNRRTCRPCSHITMVPWLKDGKCEKCGGEVYMRDDDKEEAILQRFANFERDSGPLIKYYENKGILHHACGKEKVEETYASVLDALGLRKEKEV